MYRVCQGKPSCKSAAEIQSFIATKSLLIHYNTQLFKRDNYKNPIDKVSLASLINIDRSKQELHFFQLEQNFLEAEDDTWGLWPPKTQEFFEMKKTKIETFP